MSEQDIIKERLRKKELEIQSLEEKLRSARIYVQALQDVLRAIGQGSSESAHVASLKAGSAVASAREIIMKAGKPVHVNDLLEGLGKGGSREGRASLTSSLAAYVRRGEIFTRPAPNTFGLVELGHEPVDLGDVGPPADFGREPVDVDDREIPF
jgi:hypothetical protein